MTIACICNPAKNINYPAHWIPDNCPFNTNNESSDFYFNSGLFLLRPDKNMLSDMEEYISQKGDISSWIFADQDFLNDFFKGYTHQLPFVYNALKTMRIQHGTFWDLNVIRNIHFILEKPWNDPGFNCPKQAPYMDINKLWWNMFQK